MTEYKYFRTFSSNNLNGGKDMGRDVNSLKKQLFGFLIRKC